MTLPNADVTHRSYAQSTETAPYVNSFFKDEYMTLTFGEYSGRPSDFIDFHKSDLVYFLADGWKVDAVLAKGEGGKWTVEARAVSKNEGSSTQSSFASATSENDGARTTSSSYGAGSSTGSGATANTQEGGPYWFVWSKVRLIRKRLQGDRVAQHMINSLVSAYNEGRTINSQRYDELCKLYAALVTSTEGAVHGTDVAAVTPESFTGLESGVVDRMRSIPLPEMDELGEIATKMDDRMAAWLEGRKAEINRQFDARLEQTKSQMVTAGTYNSVVWPTVASGIERDRQYALNNLHETLTGVETSLAEIKSRVFSAKVSLYEAQQKRETAILEARIGIKNSAAKVAAEIAQGKVNLTNLRNGVAQAMLSFMERRDDEYPDLEQVLSAVGQLDNDTIDPGGKGGGSAVGHNTKTELPNPKLPPIPS